MAQRRRFSAEYKREAVAMLQSSSSYSHVLLQNLGRRLCSFCAQAHLTPTHSGLLHPKFGFRATLGWSGPE